MSETTHDDEIEASRAPLLDHLVELRTRLIICVIALVVGFFACFAFVDPIYRVLLHPFYVAAQLVAVRAHPVADPRLFGLMGAVDNARDMFLVMTGAKDIHVAPPQLISTGPLELFFSKLKVAALGGVAITFPVLAWQIYAFIAPGLYKRERHAFLPFLVASPTLFAVGGGLVYYMILPFVLWFSLNQQVIGGSGVAIALVPKISEYLDLVTMLLLAFGLCFQLPVILTLLGIAGIVSSKALMAGWRYAVVGVFVVAAVITPPDPISQTLLALPIIGLYFVSVGCVRLIELRRKKEDAGTDLTVT